MAAIPVFDEAIVRQISAVLAATDSGLTNSAIDELLRTAGIEDPTPKPKSPYFYIAINKRDRLTNALLARQKKDGVANQVLHFVSCAMKPVRFREHPQRFEDWREALNEVLAFAGVLINEKGELARRDAVATTLNEARARSRRLRRQLVERAVHQRIIASCHPEIRDENYFHTVLEAAKSLAAEIRSKTGLTSDGVELVDEAFERGQASYPLLACNKLETPTDKSEQRGVAALLRGIFAAFRNPTAHEPKITWYISELDALDALSTMSLLHRKLDACVVTAAAGAQARADR
jgi:uncharacterized protein (TIGR02391 family)